MLVPRRYARTLVLLTLVALTVMFAALGWHGRASAHVPHPGLDFSLAIDTNGDTVADCGTGVGQAIKCTAPQDAILHTRVYLNSLGGVAYEGFDLRLDYSGVTSKNNPDAHAWPDCVFDAAGVSPGSIAWGCGIGVPPAPDSTYTGLVGTADFNCTSSGTIALVNGGPPVMFGTDLVTSDLDSHATGQDIRETLTINCPAAIGGVARDNPISTKAASRSPTSSDAGLLFELAMLALVGVLVMGAAYAVAKRPTR